MSRARRTRHLRGPVFYLAGLRPRASRPRAALSGDAVRRALRSNGRPMADHAQPPPNPADTTADEAPTPLVPNAPEPAAAGESAVSNIILLAGDDDGEDA